nr:MAG: hypothetical protein [Bacteriophage sp.]
MPTAGFPIIYLLNQQSGIEKIPYKMNESPTKE